jgi:phosphate transport system substrate-binding protein
MGKKFAVLLLGVVFITVLAAGCGQGRSGENAGGQPNELSGTIIIDGSSTVFPITEAVAEEFQIKHSGVRVNVGVSGTGGGFKKFSAGETDFNDASRPIKDSEREACAANNIEYVQFPVAYDGISVVVSRENDFAESMTVAELKELWMPGSIVKKWNQIRSEWPDLEVTLFGPGTDSGTFGYFTEAIAGAEGASRSDFTASEDDNVLVRGVAGNKGGLGYFGYSYYVENKDKLRAVAIDAGDGAGPVVPTDATINDGSYRPLSRPLFFYVKKESLRRPEVQAFIKFYLTEGPELIKQVKMVPLQEERYSQNLEKLDQLSAEMQ